MSSTAESMPDLVVLALVLGAVLYAVWLLRELRAVKLQAREGAASSWPQAGRRALRFAVVAAVFVVIEGAFLVLSGQIPAWHVVIALLVAVVLQVAYGVYVEWVWKAWYRRRH